jgi:hypothetical protein
MRLTEERLKELLRSQTARSTSRQGECLGEDQFVRAAAGEMSSEERRGIARHLITCTDCTEEYQLLRSLKPLTEEVRSTLNRSGDSPVSIARPLLRIVDKPASQSLPERFAAAVWAYRTGLLIAASLMIGVGVGNWLLSARPENSPQIARLNEELQDRDRRLESAAKSLEEARGLLEETARKGDDKAADRSKEEMARNRQEMSTLRGRVSQLSRPRLDTPIIDLDPSEGTRGTPGETQTGTVIPGNADLVTLILNFSNKQHSRYAIELYDSQGKRVWRGEQAQKRGNRSVNLTLPRHFVPAGLYVIKLYGLDGTQELIGDYAVKIEK